MALTFDDHLWNLRKGVRFEVLISGSRPGPQVRYWHMLREYAEKHPEEPKGWREQLKGKAFSPKRKHKIKQLSRKKIAKKTNRKKRKR